MPGFTLNPFSFNNIMSFGWNLGCPFSSLSFSCSRAHNCLNRLVESESVSIDISSARAHAIAAIGNRACSMEVR